MGGDRPAFTTPVMKWGLFAVLFLVAPAPVIVFKTYMTGPVVFVAASLVSLIAEALRPSGTAHAQIVGYFAIHLLLYAGFYYLAAVVIAKGLSFVANRRVRAFAFAALALGAALMAVLPVYGGAGTHGGAWGPINFFFAKLNDSHFGPNAALTIYGPLLLCLGAGALVRMVRWRRARGKAV